jgi:hypothetical protein
VARAEGAPVAGLFALSGLDAVRRRVEALGEEDLTRQLGLIRRTLAPPPAALAPPGGGRAAEADRFRAAAAALGDRVGSTLRAEGLPAGP